jgi:hypothetical protein
LPPRLLVIAVRNQSSIEYCVRTDIPFERFNTMTNTPNNPAASSEQQKPASNPAPQQQQQGDSKPSTDKPASQPQQK